MDLTPLEPKVADDLDEFDDDGSSAQPEASTPHSGWAEDADVIDGDFGKLSTSDEECAKAIFAESVVAAANAIIEVINSEDSSSALRFRAATYVIDRVLGSGIVGEDSWNSAFKSITAKPKSKKA